MWFFGLYWLYASSWWCFLLVIVICRPWWVMFHYIGRHQYWRKRNHRDQNAKNRNCGLTEGRWRLWGWYLWPSIINPLQSGRYLPLIQNVIPTDLCQLVASLAIYRHVLPVGFTCTLDWCWRWPSGRSWDVAVVPAVHLTSQEGHCDFGMYLSYSLNSSSICTSQMWCCCCFWAIPSSVPVFSCQMYS